jgi:hypothetical protein
MDSKRHSRGYGTSSDGISLLKGLVLMIILTSAGLLLLSVMSMETAAAQSDTISGCQGLNTYPDGSVEIQNGTTYDVTQDLEADLNDANFLPAGLPCIDFSNVNSVSIDGQGYSIVEGTTREDQGDGIFADSLASNNDISNIDINNVGGSGIGVRGDDNSFNGITITNPNDNGITEDGIVSGNTYTDISISGATNGISAENGVFTNITVTGSSGDSVLASFGATLTRLELDDVQVTVPNGQNVAINPVSNPASPPMDPDGAPATELGAYVDIDSETGSPDSNPNSVGDLRLFYDPSDLNPDEDATALADYGNGTWMELESTTGTVNGENYVEVTETLGDEFVGDTSFEPATIGIFGRNTTTPEITNVTTDPTGPIKYTYADVDDYDFFNDEGTVLDIRANLVDQFGDPLDPDPPSDSFQNDYVSVISDGSGQFVADANDDGTADGNKVSADGGLFYQYLTDMGPDDTVDITVGVGSPPSIPEIGEFEPATIQVDTMEVSLDLETVSPEPPDGFAPNDSDSPNQIQLRATLTHENGDPVTVGEDASFSVDRGNGSLSKTTGTTDSNGNVTLSYTVGEGDWGEGGLAGGSDVVINANASIEGYNTSAQTGFDVAVPDTRLDTVAQDGQVLLPDGNITIVTTTNYKGFDTGTPPIAPVEFTTDGNGKLDGGSPPVTKGTNSSGVATVTYSPVESDAGDDVTVTASDPDEAAPPDIIGDSDTFAVPLSEIDVSGDLGVTAPSDGFDVNVSVDAVDSSGTVVSELIDGTVTLNEGDSSLADSSNSTTFSPDPINSSQEYRVRVTADGYENASETKYVAPGDTSNIDVGKLTPEDVNVSATANLNQPAPSNSEFEFSLEGPGGIIQNITDTDAGATASANFSPAGAIDANRNYTVTVTSGLYEDASTETYVTPGGTDNLTFNLDYVGLKAVGRCRTINASNAPADGLVNLTGDITGSSASSCIDIEADDVTFEAGGNLIGSDDGGVAIDVEDPSSPDGPRNVTVENVTVNGWEHGVIYEDADDGTVSDIDLGSNRLGLLVNGTSEGNLVTSTTVESSLGTGVEVAAPGNTLKDTVLNSNAVLLDVFGLRVLAEGNTVENVTLSNSDGVYVDAPDNVLSGLDVTDSDGKGVYVDSDGRNATLTDLTVLDTTSDGVSLEPGANSTEITNATVTGIGDGATPANAFSVGSSNNRLTNVTARADKNSSVFVRGTGNVLREVNASDGPASGAYVTGTNTTVTSSVFNDNELAGVLVTPSADAPVFEDVTASDNGDGNRGAGFAVASSSSLLTNVTANGNTQYGVAVNGGIGNTINDSEALRNGVGGVGVAGSRTKVANVNASENAEGGINVSSSGNVIDDVTANGNGDGVVVTGDNNTVTALDADRNDDDGLDVDGSSGHTVESITVVDNGNHGVEFGATADTFTRIDAMSNDGNGVLATDSLNISNSRFGDNENGVRAEADVGVVNITATSSDSSAVFVDGGSAEVTNVTVRNPGDWAFRAVNGSTATAEGFDIGLSVVPNTTVEFDARDAALVNQTSPPSDAFNERNVSRFVEATDTSSDGYLNLTFGYDDADVSDISETELDVWTNNGTWEELGGTVDTGANKVSYNASGDELGSTYAPLANLSAVDSCRTVDAANQPENDFAFLTRDVGGSSDCLNLTVSSLTFDGQGHAVAGTGSGVGISVSNGSSSPGEPSDVTVTNVTVTDWENGVRVGDSHGATVTRTNASGNAGIGILTAGENTTVSDTLVENSGKQSIRLEKDANSATVRNTALLGNDAGSALDLFSDGNVIENVTAMSDGDSAVYVDGADNVIRSVNAVRSPVNGIDVTSDADNTTVLDTLVADNDGQGIRVEGNSFTVSRTLVAQNDEQGIRIQADSAKVEDTEILTNGRSTDVSGIDLLGNDGVLVDINVSGSGDNGVYVTGDDAVVRNATLTANNGSGVLVTSSSTNTTVVGSAVTENGEGGLYVDNAEAEAEELDVGSAVVDARASNVVLREVVSAPDAPTGREYLAGYLNATDLGPGAALNLTFSYEEDDLTGIEGEFALSVWRHDGSWNEVGGTVYEEEGEIAANVTDFSVFAPTGRADTGGGREYNEPPEAVYEVEGSLVAGDGLTLNASDSTDSDGEIEEYTWRIDGTSGKSGEEVDHTFDEPGLYEVELTVEDDSGKQDVEDDVLSIEEGMTEKQENNETVAEGNQTEDRKDTEEKSETQQDGQKNSEQDTTDEGGTQTDSDTVTQDDETDEETFTTEEDGRGTDNVGTDEEETGDDEDTDDVGGLAAVTGGDGGPVSPVVLSIVAVLIAAVAAVGIRYRRNE